MQYADQVIKRVGLIGLGIMGQPMVRNLTKARCDVTAHSRTREKVQAMAKEGAKPAESSAEVAASCQVVITMVPDSADVEVVADGPDGVFAGAKPGLIIADMSTISPIVT